MSRKLMIGDGPDEVEVGNYRPINKGSLKGSFAMCIYPSGQKIRDCLYFETEERSWFNFPSEKKPSGEYIPYISYISKDYRAILNNSVITLLKEAENEAFKSNKNTSGGAAQSPFDSSGMPF